MEKKKHDFAQLNAYLVEEDVTAKNLLNLTLKMCETWLEVLEFKDV